MPASSSRARKPSIALQSSVTRTHTAASAPPLDPSNPTTTNPGPPTATLLIDWKPAPPNTSSSRSTRDHLNPSTEIHTAASSSPVLSPSNVSKPTATSPWPPDRDAAHHLVTLSAEHLLIVTDP